jgi:hypothetical protein
VSTFPLFFCHFFVKGHDDVVTVLLANKADKNAKDDKGNTPAQRATKESIKKLLS